MFVSLVFHFYCTSFSSVHVSRLIHVAKGPTSQLCSYAPSPADHALALRIHVREGRIVTHECSTPRILFFWLMFLCPFGLRFVTLLPLKRRLFQNGYSSRWWCRPTLCCVIKRTKRRAPKWRHRWLIAKRHCWFRGFRRRWWWWWWICGRTRRWRWLTFVERWNARRHRGRNRCRGWWGRD